MALHYCAAVGGPSIIVVASRTRSAALEASSLARINRGRNISHIVLLQPMINTHATPNAIHATARATCVVTMQTSTANSIDDDYSAGKCLC